MDAPIEIVYETHSISEDNERAIASGWSHSRLSERGRELAEGLGARRRDDGFDIVFTSDLRRAVETAELAFAGSSIPVLHDWRLRECNYGDLNGAATATVHGDRRRYLDHPYPGGESWRQATARVAGVLRDLGRWSGGRVLIVGHVATRWGLQQSLDGARLEDLIDEDFAWREGWDFVLDPALVGGDSGA